MHLSDRGRRQGLGVHPLEEFAQIAAQLGLQGVTDVTERQWWRAVQAALKFLHIGFGKHRRRTGDELAQLDIGRAQLLAGFPQQARPFRPIAHHPAGAAATQDGQSLDHAQCTAQRAVGQSDAGSTAFQPGPHILVIRIFSHANQPFQRKSRYYEAASLPL